MTLNTKYVYIEESPAFKRHGISVLAVKEAPNCYPTPLQPATLMQAERYLVDSKCLHASLSGG